MTQTAIALYLGESYATLGVFDLLDAKKAKPIFEKSAYLPQTSLKNLLNQAIASCPENKVESIFVVTRYLDRLRTFRLGGSVIQVVPIGFENSYSLSNTEKQSLAAPALILAVSADVTKETLSAELSRLKKMNSEINKVVFQLPETIFSLQQSETIKSFFAENNFRMFTVPNPFDSESVRKTLLNAGSEGTKDEFLADIRDTLGLDVKTYFWIDRGFSTTFDNIDLYFSSQNFLKNYLIKENLNQLFYFDVENWNQVTVADEQIWQSPWGSIRYDHPVNQKFEISPYCELTTSSIGQFMVSPAAPQFEPGPIIAGRSVKTLILDAFSEELRIHKRIAGLFPQLNSDPIQQKVNTQFQILQKAQSLDQTRLSKAEIKAWLHFSVKTWILKNFNSVPSRIIGDFGSFFFQDLKNLPAFSFSEYSWTHEIISEARAKEHKN